MRTLNLSIVFILFMFTVLSAKAIKGNSNTFLNGYSVEKVSDDLYVLSYDNTLSTFNIKVEQTEERCNYIVEGNGVEVLYFCCENGMCLRKVPTEQASYTDEELKQCLDPKAFANQGLITRNQKRTKGALGLIACFFPETIKEDARVQIFEPNSDGIPFTADK